MYSQGVAQFYDLFADAPSPARTEPAFVRALFPAGSSILDIGAGTGTLAFALAADGYNVTALEPDPEMYAVLLARLALRNDLQDVLTPVPKAIGFDLGQRFDACLSLSVLHLLDAPQSETLFRYARAHLRTGGRFILETPVETPLCKERPRQLKAERTFGGTRYQHYTSMNRTPAGRWCTTWEFLSWRNDDLLDTRTRAFDWRPTSLAEVEALAQKAGLSLEETFAGFDRVRFAQGESQVLVAVMRNLA